MISKVGKVLKAKNSQADHESTSTVADREMFSHALVTLYIINQKKSRRRMHFINTTAEGYPLVGLQCSEKLPDICIFKTPCVFSLPRNANNRPLNTY